MMAMQKEKTVDLCEKSYGGEKAAVANCRHKRGDIRVGNDRTRVNGIIQRNSAQLGRSVFTCVLWAWQPTFLVSSQDDLTERRPSTLLTSLSDPKTGYSGAHCML